MAKIIKNAHVTYYNGGKSLCNIILLEEVSSVELLESKKGCNEYKVVFKGGAVATVETVGLLGDFKKFIEGVELSPLSRA